MAEKISFEAPRGMRDFYPEDMVWRNKVFDAFRAAGFEPYDACVVESYELLARKAGEEVGEQIYHFFDKSERHIALRAEMTPTLARMVAQRQKELVFPLAEIYTHGEEVGRCPSLLDSMIGATALAHGICRVCPRELLR